MHELLLLLFFIYLVETNGYHGEHSHHSIARYGTTQLKASGRDSFIASNKVVRKLRYVSVDDRAKVSIMDFILYSLY